MTAPNTAQHPLYDTFRAVKSFGSLDGLRCLSILAVVWHHSAGTTWVGNLFPAGKFGFLGVDLFFEISGFLIVTLVLRERDRRGLVSLKHFYARRSLRIFPLYYGMLIAFAVLYFVVMPKSAAAAAYKQDLPALVTYMTNWFGAAGLLSVTWSLSAEEQFYAVWPPIEKWFASYARMIIVAAIVVSQVIHFGLIDPLLARWPGWGPTEPSMLRETTYTPICLGVLLAHLLHDPVWYERLYRWFGAKAWAPVWLVVLVVLTNFLPDDIRGWGRLSVHLVMLFLLASCVVNEGNGLHRVLSWKPIARIGTLSYGIYLLHQVALAVAGKGLERVHWRHPVIEFLVGGMLTCVLAELSYRFYESRFLTLRDRFRS